MAKVRLNLDVSQEIADFLDTLAQENATTKTDVMRRAIALLKVAHEEKKRNRSMGFVASSRDDVLDTKIVGVL
jgi:predicted transcriptional regulator